jgi:hypothetical protein
LYRRLDALLLDLGRSGLLELELFSLIGLLGGCYVLVLRWWCIYRFRLGLLHNRRLY